VGFPSHQHTPGEYEPFCFRKAAFQHLMSGSSCSFGDGQQQQTPQRSRRLHAIEGGRCRKLFPGSARKTRQARLLAHLTAGNTGKNIGKRGANAGDQPNCFCFENKIWHDLAESVVILFFEEW